MTHREAWLMVALIWVVLVSVTMRVAL